MRLMCVNTILQLTHRKKKLLKSLNPLIVSMKNDTFVLEKQRKVKRKDFSLTTYRFGLFTAIFFFFLDNSKLKPESGHATSISNAKNTT